MNTATNRERKTDNKYPTRRQNDRGRRDMDHWRGLKEKKNGRRLTNKKTKR